MCCAHLQQEYEFGHLLFGQDCAHRLVLIVTVHARLHAASHHQSIRRVPLPEAYHSKVALGARTEDELGHGATCMAHGPSRRPHTRNETRGTVMPAILGCARFRVNICRISGYLQRHLRLG
jgi:hypothetical protein